MIENGSSGPALENGPARQETVEDLVHDLGAIVWEADAGTGRLTFVSRGAERLLGFPVERWLSEPDFRVREVLHPEDRERVAAVWRRGLEEGRDHRVEYRARTADGEVRWLRDVVRVASAGPDDGRVRGVSTDITEEKRAENALASQKAYYQGILDHIDSDFAVFDREGRFEYINPSSIGDPEIRRWAIGRTNIDYCRERGRPLSIGRRRHALIEAAVREGETIEVEEEMETAGGGKRVILRRHFPLRDDDGEVVRVIGQGYDITERKATEEALRESEERFRLMVEGSEEVFFYERDREHRFTYLSPSVERVLGYEADEILGQPDEDLLTGDLSEYAVTAQGDASRREGKRSRTYTAVVRHRSGAEVVLEVLERPAVRDGRVVGAQGFARDVTERRRAEAELDLERQKQDALLNAIPDIVWMKDEQSRFLAVNDALARAVGRPRHEIIGKTDADFFSPEMAEHYRRDDLRVLRKGRQITVDETVVGADGQEKVVETIKVPFYGPNGEVVGTAGIARDVTDRTRAERALRESEARFRALIENVSDAIAILDGEGDIRYLSPAFERISGYSAEDRIGRSGLDGVHPEDEETARRAWRSLLRAPDRTTSTEVRVRRADGEWRRVEIVGKNLLNDPVIEGVVVTYHDVTERRSLEAKLRGAQKMEAIGRLAGGIAHDFNNVLTAIKGNAQFVLEDALQTDRLREDMEEIVACTNHAHDLTRQLLAFSRQQLTEQRVLSPERVVRSAEKMLRRLIGDDVELMISVSDETGNIKADPTQMEQVLVNLAINARDAMPGGGRLRIAIDTVQDLDAEVTGIPATIRPGRYVRIAVSDSGVGMDAATRERIFEPFFTTKAPGAGTGLGLATAYGIIKQTKGYIGVTSVPGEGTTFEIYLPQVEGEVVCQEERERRTGRRGGSETILLVEDQDAVRSLARRALQRVGYTVMDACDGQEALAIWDDAAGTIDLLLTDVVMPHMGGKELAHRLLDRRADLKVLYMSGYAEEHIVHRGVLESGANLLEKPFDPKGLQARVREVLDAGTAR